MSRFRRIAAIAAGTGAALAAAAVFAALLIPAGCDRGGPERFDAAFPAMGTLAAVTLYGERAACEAGFRTVRRKFEEIERRFSRFRPDSELSKLNAAAARDWVVCSAPMWRILTAAREAWKFSGGAFDVSAGPLMTLWGFYRKRNALPSADEIAAVRERVGLQYVEFDDARRAVRFARPGIELDLGGLVKGYAVDCAAEQLRASGLRRGLVDLGGNLYALPEPPPGRKAYRIAIRAPNAKSGVAERWFPLRDRAVATSGAYERFVEFAGVRYGHIMNPATGRPAPGGLAVSVFASTALRADVLSTVLYVKGPEWAVKLREIAPDAEAVWVTIDGGVQEQWNTTEKP